MKKILLSAGFLLGLWTFVHAQNPIVPSYAQNSDAAKRDIGISSPQIWSFMKYGGSTPSLYTGTVSASIPIYTYADEDFTLPISLSYASNGYIPNVQANETGLGWFLNAGGYITRTVNGIPDEFDSPTIKGCNARLVLDHTNVNLTLSQDQARFEKIGDKNSDDYIYTEQINDYKVETEPDTYSFNFL